MPSDDRMNRALVALADRIAEYRGAVTVARERVQSLLAQGGGVERAALALGPFAAGRLDLDRFAALDDGTAMDAAARSTLRRIAGILDDLSRMPDDGFVVDVPPGGRLRYFVANAFASLGRVFGAMRAVELIRGGRFDAVSHAPMLEGFGFDLWSKADRRAAPPLIIRVAGSDLRANLLAEFLDGRVHIAVIADGRCTPAPLARLITPGTLVLQAHDGAELDRFAAFPGPAIAAFVPGTSASFLHDPAGGRSFWQRVKIMSRPDAVSRTRLDSWSTAQQADELAHLDALAERPALSDTPIESLGDEGGDPVDRLASWLLTESGAG